MIEIHVEGTHGRCLEHVVCEEPSRCAHRPVWLNSHCISFLLPTCAWRQISNASGAKRNMGHEKGHGAWPCFWFQWKGLPR